MLSIKTGATVTMGGEIQIIGGPTTIPEEGGTDETIEIEIEIETGTVIVIVTIVRGEMVRG